LSDFLRPAPFIPARFWRESRNSARHKSEFFQGANNRLTGILHRLSTALDFIDKIVGAYQSGTT
jgi:hypothetical protein